MAPSAATAKRRQQRVAARQQARCRHHDAAIVISALRLHVDWLLGLIWELWNVEQTYAAPAVAVDQVNAFGQVADFVQAAPNVVTAAPLYVRVTPSVQYVNTVTASDVDVNQINVFGQEAERDFVQDAPAEMLLLP